MYVSVPDAIFATDKKTFYTPQLPDDIDKDKITSTLASDNGKYFAAAAYDEDSSSNSYIYLIRMVVLK